MLSIYREGASGGALKEAEPHMRLCESVHLDRCICLDRSQDPSPSVSLYTHMRLCESVHLDRCICLDRSQDPSPSVSLYISTQGQRGGKEPF